MAAGARIHFLVLAHNHPECLDELVGALHESVPDSAVSVFNGGSDADFYRGGDAPVLATSRKLTYGNLTAFHLEGIAEVNMSDRGYDYLVTLDQDVLPLAAGLDTFLAGHQDLGYLAVRLRPARTDVPWTLGGSTVRLVHQTWGRRWAPLLATEHPMWAFNPCQIFRRDTAEALMALPNLDAIKRQAYGSKIWAVEEIVLPTLAHRLATTSAELPGGDAVDWRWHSPAEIADFAAQPDHYFVHRVTMQRDAPDRLAIAYARRGAAIPSDVLAAPATATPDTPLPPRTSPARWKHAVQRRWAVAHVRVRG